MNALSIHPRISIFVFAFLLVLISSPTRGQRVAQYSFGKYETKGYEHLAFWVKANKRAKISYSYGKADKEVNLTYAGKDIFKGKSCFKVQFPNGHVLYVIPKGWSLEVTDGESKYSKHFRWQYEGPINGIGTFCEACVEDEKEAMNLIRQIFMK